MLVDKAMKFFGYSTVFLILLTASVVSDAEDLSKSTKNKQEQSALWSLSSASSFRVSKTNVEAAHLHDGRTVSISLDKWDSSMEEQLSRALFSTPLRYRLHPSKQAEMTVEVYSPNSDVDYSMRKDSGSSVVLMGEMKPGKRLINLMNTLSGEDSVSAKINDLLLRDKFNEVRQTIVEGSKAQSITVDDPKQQDLLARALLSVFDLISGQKKKSRCPNVVYTSKTNAAMEATVLSAWCRYLNKEQESASKILERMKELTVSKSIDESIRSLELRIVTEDILNASRNKSYEKMAETVLKHWDLLSTLPPVGIVSEIIGTGLIDGGFGVVFSKMAGEMIARADAQEMPYIAPLTAEAYLAIDQHIRASDAASYFLMQSRPSWIEGRLRRVRGIALFKDGNWSQAVDDLKKAKQNLLEWRTEDQLVLLHALLILDRDKKEVAEAVNNAGRNRERRLPGNLEKWFLRLFGEAEVMEQRIPSKEVIELLPAHVLYKAAEQSRLTGNLKASEYLFSEAEAKGGAWGKLAEVSREIQEASQQLDIVKGYFK